MNLSRSATCLLLLILSGIRLVSASDDVAPDAHKILTKTDHAKIEKQQREVLRQNPVPTEGDAGAVDVHSRRGDAFLFLGRSSDAVREYRAMVTLQPRLDASHWRLGIAYYLAGQPEKAAAQFERYHAFDNVDRENGIWRFLSHHRAFGAERARKELLRYSRDDREPFPAVYRMFDGSITPEQALRQIPSELPKQEREKRLFYTELYVGMLHSVRDEDAAAVAILSKAVSRDWPRGAGFGPAWMWQVARLEHDRLREKVDKSKSDQTPPQPVAR